MKSIFAINTIKGLVKQLATNEPIRKDLEEIIRRHTINTQPPAQDYKARGWKKAGTGKLQGFSESAVAEKKNVVRKTVARNEESTVKQWKKGDIDVHGQLKPIRVESTPEGYDFTKGQVVSSFNEAKETYEASGEDKPYIEEEETEVFEKKEVVTKKAEIPPKVKRKRGRPRKKPLVEPVPEVIETNTQEIDYGQMADEDIIEFFEGVDNIRSYLKERKIETETLKDVEVLNVLKQIA